jgi:hypothetical protein
MQASVDRRDTTQSVVGYRHDHQDFSGQHHDLSGCVLMNVAAFPGSTAGARTSPLRRELLGN